MGKVVRITASQEAYLLAHLNDRPRSAVARAAGVSVAKFYELIRLHGGEVGGKGGGRAHPEWEAAVRRECADHTYVSIERRYGMPRGKASHIARMLGLRHSAETEARIRRSHGESMLRSQATMDFAARGRKLRAVRRMDELRLLSGEPQRTRLRFRELPNKVYHAKWHLLNKYGYEEDEWDAWTLVAGPATRRRPAEGRGGESYYAGKYHLVFRAAAASR